MRVVAVGSLLLVLLALPVVFGSLWDPPEQPDHEGWSAIAENEVGVDALLIGRVTAVDPVVITVSVDEEPTLEVVLTDVPRPVTPGDTVIVYGEIVEEDTMAVQRIVVERPIDLWYTYGVSALGGVWVLTRLVRYWEFDSESGGLAPRIHSLNPQHLVPGTGELRDDA